MKIKEILFCCSLLLMTGCATVSVQEPPADDLSGQQIKLSYFNSGVFESTLRHVLASNADVVNIEVNKSFKKSELPEELQEWINQCSKSQGAINMISEEELASSKSVLGSIAKKLANFAFEYYFEEKKRNQKERWYSPIKNYNIDIIYGTEEGKVISMVFKKR